MVEGVEVLVVGLVSVVGEGPVDAGSGGTSEVAGGVDVPADIVVGAAVLVARTEFMISAQPHGAILAIVEDHHTIDAVL